MPKTTKSDTTPSIRAATLRITSGGRRIFSRPITPETADDVLHDGQQALLGHDDAVLDLDTPAKMQSALGPLAGARHAAFSLLADAARLPLDQLRVLCATQPELLEDLPRWASDLQQLTDRAVARGKRAMEARQ
ncbi:MAG: hypothetical protein JO212_12295 [Acetobacteraceae bacterium]|nr:hypothetical protein [Acetobacteraceae bacterium]